MTTNLHHKIWFDFVRPEEFPEGLRCADCHREIPVYRAYARRAYAVCDGVPVVELICVYC